MKSFAKLFVVALAVTLLAALFAMPASAAVGMPDPNTLQPASDRVVFIMDAPEGGTLPGDGSGLDAENPLEPIDHESFDPDADAPKMHLQTAFYQATEMLAETGGTIVICGPVFIGIDQSYGSGSTTRDLFTAQFKEKTIKFTSVYNGVDYRQTNGAKIILDTPAEIGVHGQSIWENIDIETIGTNRVISFNFWSTLVGEGVNCYPKDELFVGIAPNYVSLSGGHRYSGGVDIQTNLVVKSGSYNVIAAGEWGVNNTRRYKEADDPASGIASTNNMDGTSTTHLTLEGTTTVYGQVIGTNRQNAEFSGNVNVTINGGKYECDINLVGPSGMVNQDGMAILKINGGDFSNCWSINDLHAPAANNPPSMSILDFSGWTGDITGIAQAFNVVTTFTKFNFPAGITQDQVIAAASQLNNGGSSTDTPATQPSGGAPAATQPSGGAPATQAPAANDDVKETQAAVSVQDNGNSNLTLILIIVIAVLVLGLGGAVVFLLLKNKKAAK